ncbi:class I glutamine amidotransferase-like protein [Auricularia subglabra TFB-10046 SS5]|nr:class I glutamine amidotransferase-like protein [Auricularia subglabra TFB-10046 SS5]
MTAPKVLICMADNGQDPTECAVPWEHFTKEGFVVEFATENGTVPRADQLLVHGSLFKSVLGPKQAWTDTYHKMTQCDAFQHPHAWSAPGFSMDGYDAVVLPGGHDKPIKQYLESSSLHAHLKALWPRTHRSAPSPSPPEAQTEIATTQPEKKVVVGAICHGVLVLAFAGLLHDVETTTLPQWLEGLGQRIGALWGRGQYYRTYPDRWTFEDILRTVEDKAQYKRGPMGPGAFAHTDPKRTYVSARWPADAQLFAERIVEEVRANRQEWEKAQPAGAAAAPAAEAMAPAPTAAEGGKAA